MDIRQLQYFTRIAECGSFREAAARANVAQSALSRHIRTLEQELGVALFDRHARGVRLTADGTRLFERAAAILRDIEEARAELMSATARPRGTVTVGASATSSRLLYARLAQTASERYPEIALNLVEGASYVLLEGLDTGRIDIGILVNPEPRAAYAMEPLVSETVYLVGPAGGAPLPDGTAGIADLDDRPLILFPRPSGSRMSLEALAARHGIRLSVRFEAASPDVIKDFVVRGLGYGLMPHSSLFRDFGDGTLVAVPFDGLAITRTFIRRTDRPAAAAADAIAGLIREAFAGLAAEGYFGPRGG